MVMNKKGAGLLLPIIGGALVLGLVLGLFMIGTQSIVQETKVPVSPSGNTLAGCVEDTTLTWNGVDALEAGTSVVTTNFISVDGGEYVSGVPSASPGNVLKALAVNNTNYHNAYVDGAGIEIKCNEGTKTIDVPLYETATLVMTMFNTEGNAITDTNTTGLGTTNQTIQQGETKTMKLRFDGENRASSSGQPPSGEGGLLCVLETNNRTATKDIVLSGHGAKQSSKGVPDFYTLSGSTSFTRVYEIDPIVGAISPELSLQVESTATGDLGTNGNSFVSVHCFSKDWFRDTDGTIVYGVQNRDGTERSLSNYRFRANFQT